MLDIYSLKFGMIKLSSGKIGNLNIDMFCKDISKEVYIDAKNELTKKMFRI